MDKIVSADGASSPQAGVHAALRIAAVLLVALAAKFAPPFYVFADRGASLVVTHLLLELFAVLVSMLVALISWYSINRHIDSSARVLFSGFILVALLDLTHALAYDGMPALITPNSTQKSVVFWLAGRTVEATTLLLVALRVRPRLPDAGWILIPVALYALLFWIGIYHLDWTPALFVDGAGTTPLKFGFEIALTVSFAVIGGIAFVQARLGSAGRFDSVALSAFCMAAAELMFSSYRSTADLPNVLGHLFKLLAYVAILVKVFEIRIKLPYDSLLETQNRLTELNADLENRIALRTQELRASNRDLEAFAYSIAHDLKSPLRIIQGFSTVLGKEVGASLPRERAHMIERIAESAAHMAGQIDGMLLLSRLSQKDIRSERVDISALARQVIADLRVQDPHREVSVTIDEGIHVQGDADLLRSMVQNLLDNAWKYTRGTPHARIDVARLDKETAAFSVSDNGAGFDMSAAGAIYRLFQRYHDDKEFAGFGIGLATVKRIVDKHGGIIDVHSAPGKGANFALRFPTPGVVLERERDVAPA